MSLLKSSKFYAEGFLMKKVEVGPDGKTVSLRHYFDLKRLFTDTTFFSPLTLPIQFGRNGSYN